MVVGRSCIDSLSCEVRTIIVRRSSGSLLKHPSPSQNRKIKNNILSWREYKRLMLFLGWWCPLYLHFFHVSKNARWILEDGIDPCHVNHIAIPIAVVWNEESLLDHLNTASGYSMQSVILQIYSFPSLSRKKIRNSISKYSFKTDYSIPLLPETYDNTTVLQQIVQGKVDWVEIPQIDDFIWMRPGEQEVARKLESWEDKYTAEDMRWSLQIFGGWLYRWGLKQVWSSGACQGNLSNVKDKFLHFVPPTTEN